MVPELNLIQLDLTHPSNDGTGAVNHRGVLSRANSPIGLDQQIQETVRLIDFAPKMGILSSSQSQQLAAKAFYSEERLVRVIYSKGQNSDGVDQLEIHEGSFNGYELNGKGVIRCPQSICRNSLADKGPITEGVFEDGVLVEGVILCFDGSFTRTLGNGRFDDSLIVGKGIMYFPNGGALIGEYEDGLLEKGKKIQPRDDEGIYQHGISSETGVFDLGSDLIQGIRRFQNGTIEQVGPPIDDEYLESLLQFDETRFSRRELFEELLRNMN